MVEEQLPVEKLQAIIGHCEGHKVVPQQLENAVVEAHQDVTQGAEGTETIGIRVNIAINVFLNFWAAHF